MVKPKRHNIWVIILILSLLSPFIFFSSSRAAWQGGAFVHTVFQEIVYPFEYAWKVSTDFVVATLSRYVFLTEVAEENERLKKDLELQRVRTISFDEQILEVTRLRKLLGFTEGYEYALTPAEVLGTPSFLPFQSIRINKGKISDLVVGMPAVTADGVVGRLIRVGSAFSDVQLLTDPNFSVDVLLQRTRIRGVLSGNIDFQCIVSLDKQAEIRIGDTVITSGIVGSFPKGLPVGHVKRISYSSDNISQEVIVEPWIDYKRIEELLIIETHDKEFNKVEETVGREWIESRVKNAGG